jgi:hypothetical protein
LDIQAFAGNPRFCSDPIVCVGGWVSVPIAMFFVRFPWFIGSANVIGAIATTAPAAHSDLEG